MRLATNHVMFTDRICSMMAGYVFTGVCLFTGEEGWVQGRGDEWFPGREVSHFSQGGLPFFIRDSPIFRRSSIFHRGSPIFPGAVVDPGFP